MQLIDIGPQHQSQVRNFSTIPNPGTSRGRKLARFEPVIRKVNPGAFSADHSLVLTNILRQDIVLGGILRITANAAVIKPLIKFSRRRRRDRTGKRCDCRHSHPERSEAESSDPAAPRKGRTFARHDRTVAAVYDRRNSYRMAVIIPAATDCSE